MEMTANTGYHKGEDQRWTKAMAGSSLAEGIAGAGAVAVSIMGLSAILPTIMASIATICIGCALMFEGGAIASRFSVLLSRSGKSDVDYEMGHFGSGMTAEFVGGAAGLVLGILSLLGVAPLVLAPSAAIIYGGALIMGSGATGRLSSIALARPADESAARRDTSFEVAREAMSAASGVQVLIGLAAVTLGILALARPDPIRLTLVAMLAVGFADLLSGSAISARLLNVFRR